MSYDDSNDDRNHDRQPSAVLPTDQFDKMLSRLVGLPNGAHTDSHVVQSMDWYGNVTSYMSQTVKTDEGQFVFLTLVNAAGYQRIILPPKVLALIDRQRDTTVTQVRRRHGKRLAEERAANGTMPTFTPEMRAKGLATRKKKAAARKARRKGVR